MRIVEEQDPTTLEGLRRPAAGRFGDSVKAAVDLEPRAAILDADPHADGKAELLALGARQRDLRGINRHPDLPESDRLEFDSRIGLRSSSVIALEAWAIPRRVGGQDTAPARGRIPVESTGELARSSPEGDS